MRKTLARIHTWFGLFCAPILVIFGLTSLQFNHDFSFMRGGSNTVTWQKTIQVQDTSDDTELCRRIYDAVGLKGRLYWWTAHHGDDGSFSFSSKHPGKSYKVTVNAARDHADVEESRFSLMRVLIELHGARTYTGAGLSWIWMLYTNIAIAFVVYAGASGIYFWTKRKAKSRLDWVLLLALTGGSLLLIATVRLWG